MLLAGGTPSPGIPTRLATAAATCPPQEFAGQYEIAAMDMRGYGDSDAPKVNYSCVCFVWSCSASLAALKGQGESSQSA